MTTRQLIRLLRYVAASPPREYGGFDTTIVEMAKAALRVLRAKGVR